LELITSYKREARPVMHSV